MASNRKFKHPIIKNSTQDERDVIDDRVRIIQWNGIEIKIRPLLTIDESHEMIGNILWMYSNIYQGCASSDMVLFGIKLYTVLYYSDIELPDDLEERYRIIYGTDLYDAVYNVISKKQIDDIIESVQIMIYTNR